MKSVFLWIKQKFIQQNNGICKKWMNDNFFSRNFVLLLIFLLVLNIENQSDLKAFFIR